MALDPEQDEQDVDDGVARCRCGMPWVDVFGYHVYCAHCDRVHEPEAKRLPCPFCEEYRKAFKAEEAGP